MESLPTTYVIVHPSRAQRDFLYGFLTAALGAAVVRGALGSGGTRTHVVAALAGVLLVVVAAFWIWQRLRPSRLEVGPTLIQFIDPVPRPSRWELHRAGGGVVVGVRRISVRNWVAYICQPDTNTLVDLNYYKVRQVFDACQAQGWPVTERIPGRKPRS